MEKELKMGVAVDPWKTRTYKRAIEKSGFIVSEVVKAEQLGFHTIMVIAKEKEKDKLADLLKKLEAKYSQRNKMN